MQPKSKCCVVFSCLQGRKSLGALGLTGSMALRKIGELSGGEKARVALAAFALIPCNVLLLDEASNHLDHQTIDSLTGALQTFKGAMIAITHNRAFATSLNATHILRVENGQAKLSNNMGLSAADFDHNPAEPEPKSKGKQAVASASPAASSNGASISSPKGSRSSLPSPPPPAAAPAAAAAPAKSGSRKLSWKESQEYEKLGKEVDVLNNKQEALNLKLRELSAAGGKDQKALNAASAEMGRLAAELEAKSERWMELAELAGDL